MRDSARTGILAILFVVAVAVFVPTLGYGFVYDDHRFVAENPALSEWTVLWRAFTDPTVQTADGTHAGLWRPLRTLSFAIDAGIFGGAAWAAHLHNVLLHGVGTVLVALLLERTGAGRPATVAGALVYALHPAQVECVAWVSSRGDLLAAAFLWGALLAQRPGRAWPSYWLGVAALLSKEQAVVWPALAFLFALAGGTDAKDAARRSAVPLLITATFVVLRHAILTEPFQEGGVGAGRAGFVELGAMLAHQSWFALFPVGAVFDWQMPMPGAGVGIVALLPFALLVPRATRVPTLWFLAALVPTLFVQALIPLNIRTADRFLLFALPALAMLVARGLDRAPRVAPAVGLLVLALGSLTATGQRVWESDEALWSHTAARVDGHWRARAWLGVAALEAGDPGTAAAHLSQAVDAAPGDAKTRFRLAEALQRLAATAEGDDVFGLTTGARDQYSEAARLFRIGRQENADLLAPLATVRAIDLTLALGDVDGTVQVLEALLRGTRPPVPSIGAELWNADVELLAGHVEQFVDPGRPDPFAPRIRAWKVTP